MSAYRQEVDPRNLKWSSHRLCLKEGPADVVLPAATQEVQLATEAAGHVLHYHHLICPMHVNHCLVQLGHKAGQGQTGKDNHVCREDHRC